MKNRVLFRGIRKMETTGRNPVLLGKSGNHMAKVYTSEQKLK